MLSHSPNIKLMSAFGLRKLRAIFIAFGLLTLCRFDEPPPTSDSSNLRYNRDARPSTDSVTIDL
jgi:hypothetical protein